MAERIATPTKANPDRVKEHAEVVNALDALREHLGESHSWESIEHAVRAAALELQLLVRVEDGAR
jgi:hypothetical protein